MSGVSEFVSDAPTGEVLVAAAKAGDPDAMRALWERDRRWIAAVLLAHKPSFEDLEDLLQEVAVTFVSRIDTLRDESSFRAWLRTIALNAARAAGRNGKYRPRGELPPHDHLPGRGGDEHRLAMNEQLGDMLHRVAQLPEAYREPLLLRAMRGMRSREIAALLDIPPPTVDTRIARARRMLREGRPDGDESADTKRRGAGHRPAAPPSANSALKRATP
ncbi:MAG: sigma-70 family RNA polymerase sigma factor [Planctomycetota bacterium]|nr:sigma-70 family RNA polymerase sigma factor [Planctomycetota bacterium]